MKVMERLGIQGIYLNITQASYSKPIVNINLNEEKLKAIPLKPRTKQRLLFPYLLNIVLDTLARAIRKLKDTREYNLEKKKSKY